MPETEAAIIGAGPYGLSISAHLRAAGTEHMVVGSVMDTWRAHMPEGMFLKSEPYGSDFSSPVPASDVRAYCARRGLEYKPRLGPVPLARFLGYAEWFTGRFVPEVCDDTVTGITPGGEGFKVSFTTAAPVTCAKVVVATGVRPYAHVPEELAGLPPDLVTHTTDHRRLDHFRGRRVAVVGAGQSALETAALLHEQGADVTLIARGPALQWAEPNPGQLSLLGHVRRPTPRLCEGWRCAFWNTPGAFQMLPRQTRVTKARSVLGPSGSWWLKERIEGVIDVRTGQRIREAAVSGSGVRLRLDANPAGRPAGAPDKAAGGELTVDHVIAGTGFRVDLSRLGFLPDTLRAAIATVNGYPLVSRDGASTVPGLYFAGAHTAVSLGPSMRFIAGTHNVAAKLARSLAT
jgi:cation diffusion facilitator CzcD-associated flavoprotein CzcO